MQNTGTYLVAATALFGVLAFGVAPINAQTIDTRVGELKYENGYPTQETSQKLYDEMDLQRASQAYMWSVPAVNFASIRAGWFRDLGATYNDIILYPDFLDTKSSYLTGNNTTIYAASQIDLKDGPVVVEVPAGPTAGMFADLWFRTSGVGRLGPDKARAASTCSCRRATRVSCRRKGISSCTPPRMMPTTSSVAS